MSIVTQDNTVLSHVKPSELLDDPDNLRRDLGDKSELGELAASIASVGVMNPLLVRLTTDGPMIVAGHRRKAAALLAIEQGLVEDGFVIPVLLVDATPEQVTEAMLIENLQRADLDPLEEATGYSRLIGLGMKQKDIAKAVGRGAAHVSRRLGLLSLPEKLQKRIQSGEVGLEVAAELVKIKDETVLAELAEEKSLRSHDVDYAVRKVEQRTAAAKLAEELRGLGLAVYVKDGYGDPGEATFLAEHAQGLGAGETFAKVGVTYASSGWKGEAPAGAAAVVVDHHGSLEFFGPVAKKEAAGKEVVNPSTGATRHQSVPKSQAEKDRDRKAREAKQLRDDFLRSVIAKPRKGDVQAYALTAVLRFGGSYALDASRLLDLTKEDGKFFNGNEGWQARQALEQFAEQSDANLLRAVLAIVAAAHPDDVAKDYEFSLTAARKEAKAAEAG